MKVKQTYNISVVFQSFGTSESELLSFFSLVLWEYFSFMYMLDRSGCTVQLLELFYILSINFTLKIDWWIRLNLKSGTINT